MAATKSAGSTGRKPQGIIVCVDVVLATIHDERFSVLVHQRPNTPFKGALALPGGYVRTEADRSTEEAALRVLAQKTGLKVPYLEQIRSYSGPQRDPDGWSVSVAYLALTPVSMIDGALLPNAQWVDAARPPKLAFDHRQIVADAVHRIRNKSAYSTLPAHFCQPEFTLGELQQVYEAILGKKINKVSFRRRMTEMDGFEELNHYRQQARGAPAKVWRIKPELHGEVSSLMRGFGDL